MRLKTKLVLITTAITFAIVLVVAGVFLAELLRQRIEQTAAADEVLAHQVLLATQQAVTGGIKAHPPAEPGDEAFRAAVMDALRSDEPLAGLMSSIVRYSPTVQDVTITDDKRNIMASSDPLLLRQSAPYRTNVTSVRDAGIFRQGRVVFGPPSVLDIPLALDRNGAPFLIVHLGVRSSLLRNSYAPLLRASILLAFFAVAGCILAAAFLAAFALRPIEQINKQLEALRAEEDEEETDGSNADDVVRAEQTITRLGQRMRVSEQQQVQLQSNLNQMLGTLKDGLLLFTADNRVVLASEAIANFLPLSDEDILDAEASEIFTSEPQLDTRVRAAFASRTDLMCDPVRMSSGRMIDLSISFLADSTDENALGAMLTLHNTESELELEQEIEVSRRLASIGRLMAGVGHEVKNPINAMVVHLELLRSKLEDEAHRGAIRHVDILSSEMQRLDRVVQTLADFSRPLDLQLHDCNLHEIVNSVIDLAGDQLQMQNNVAIVFHPSAEALLVRVDAETLRQALLNILLNAVQSMPGGGRVEIDVTPAGSSATITIRDHGTGIPDDIRDKIFDLYFTTKPSGSGIGLAMAYRIVQLHGGAIHVQSNTDLASSDHGTRFQIHLPLVNKLISHPVHTEGKAA